MELGSQVVPAQTSNYFVEVPSPVDAVTSDGVTVAYTAVAAAGRAWAMVLEATGSVSSAQQVKLAQDSLGGASCKASEQLIDNSRQSLKLTDCGLIEGQSYKVVVYVEMAVGEIVPGSEERKRAFFTAFGAPKP